MTGHDTATDVRSDVDAGIAALEVVSELGPGRIDQRHVEAADRLRARIDERLAFGDGLTVVALVGGTGVGKSALANALVGRPIVAEGVRRPTTGRPFAVVPADRTVDAADDPAAPGRPVRALLDWLGVEEHAVVPAEPSGLPEGLVLLDLPDHDSVVAAHREFAARLAGRADVVVVVVDPVKYARADLHQGPLAALTEHAEVVTVVLNRSDELAPEELAWCRAALASTLAAGGHREVDLLTTSAVTGDGVGALRDRLRTYAGWRSAAHRRLVADAAVLAARMDEDLAELPDPVPDTDGLLDAVWDATDAEQVVSEAQVAYRRDARAALRSPLARLVWLPLRGAAGVARAFGVGDRLPAAAVAAPAAARIATALAAELRLHRATGDVHAVLGETIERLAAQGAPALADAVGGVGVRPAVRRWWSLMAVLRGVAELVALTGFVWLVALGVAEWLQLPPLPTPQVSEVLAWPTALLLGGALVRLVLGLLARSATGAGARRHRDTVAHVVRRRLRCVVEERLLEPYACEFSKHVRLREAVAAARR